MSSIDEKFKAMRSDIDLELAIHKNEIDQLSRCVDSVIQRLNDLEENSGHQMSAGNSQSNSSNDDPSLTVIAMNVQETEEPILDVGSPRNCKSPGQQRNSRGCLSLKG
uniref:Uncharacterized protein n=1 Tax=Magallana gigas TaxID=29159 RepID=K1P6Q2_MAGGI